MEIFKNIKKAVSDIFSKKDIGGSSFMLDNSNMPTTNRQDDFMNLYESVGYVNACINARAERMGQTQFRVISRFKAADEWKERPSHPVLKLLENPSDEMSQYELMKLTEVYLKVSGDCFWLLEKGEVTGAPKKIYFLDPRFMTVIADKNANDLSGQFRILGYRYRDYNGRETILDRNEVVQFKESKLTNILRGVSPTQAGYVYIKTEEYSSSWTANFIHNDSTPSGVLVFKGQIAPDQWEKLKSQYKNQYGGIKNAGKTLIVKNTDADFTKIGHSLSDIDLEKLKNMTRGDIMFMYQVNKTVMGVTDDVNRANAEASLYSWMINVIQPEMDMFAGAIQKQLIPEWKLKGQYRIEAVNQVPEDVERKHNIVNTATYLSPNEKRKKMGDEPTKDKNANYIYEAAGKLPIAEVKTVKKSIKNNFNIKLDKPQEKEVQRLKSGFTEAQAEKSWRQMITINDKYEEEFKKKAEGLFEQQKNTVINNLIKQESISKVGLKTKINLLMDRKKYEKIWQEAFTPLYYSVIREQGERANAMIQLKSIKDFNSNSILVRNYVASKVRQFATEVGKTTRNNLVDLITNAVEEGDDIPNMAKQIVDVFSIDNIKRATLIARTEVMRAAGFATRLSYDQSEAVKSYEWYTATDDRVCQFCDEMMNRTNTKGRIIPKGSTFFEKGDQLIGRDGGVLNLDYEDIDHPPLHPGCRCDLLPVIK